MGIGLKCLTYGVLCISVPHVVASRTRSIVIALAVGQEWTVMRVSLIDVVIYGLITVVVVAMCKILSGD